MTPESRVHQLCCFPNNRVILVTTVRNILWTSQFLTIFFSFSYYFHYYKKIPHGAAVLFLLLFLFYFELNLKRVFFVVYCYLLKIGFFELCFKPIGVWRWRSISTLSSREISIEIVFFFYFYLFDFIEKYLQVIWILSNFSNMICYILVLVFEIYRQFGCL